MESASLEKADFFVLVYISYNLPMLVHLLIQIKIWKWIAYHKVVEQNDSSTIQPSVEVPISLEFLNNEARVIKISS